jgi:hypothetical protein
MLLPDEIRVGLPLLYSQENEMDQIIHIKFFIPTSSPFAQYIEHFAQYKRLSKWRL